MAMFIGFHAYDDEGYFLQLLRDYLNGQPLLSPATPIYGPFFFETMGALFKVVGVVPDNDSGRLVTLALWLLSILLGAFTVHRLTRNPWLAAGALLVGFRALLALTTEPMNPQALIALLTIAMAAAATSGESRPRLRGALIGAIVAALCLIKINVGVFAGAAVALIWAAGLTDRWRRIVMPLIGTVFVVMAFALVEAMLRKAWALEFASVVALSAAAIVVMLWRGRPDMNPRPYAVWIAAWIAGGAAGLAAVCLGVAIAGGTSPAYIWNGLVVVTLRVPDVFAVPLEINPFVDLIAALSLAGAILVRLGRGRIQLTPATRVAVGLCMWAALLLLPTTIVLLTIPLAWVALSPPAGDGEDPVGPYARAFLPALSVAYTLQAYPVSGTELSLAALPQLMVGAICVSDGIRMAQRQGATRRFVAVASRFGVALGALAFLVTAAFTVTAFQSESPLGLPGAQSVRLPQAQAADLQAMVAAIDKDCSTFITYPGMNSFYIWTGSRPPTEVRSEVWMITFDSNQQRALVDRLSSQPGLCVVKDQRQVEFWTRGAAAPDRPLVRFIDDEFAVALSAGDYQLLVRRSPA